MTEKDYPTCEYCGQPMTQVLENGTWYWGCANKKCKYNEYIMDPQPDQQPEKK